MQNPNNSDCVTTLVVYYGCMSNTVEETIREYYRVVGDLDCTEDQLTRIVAPEAVFTEHPNPIAPEAPSARSSRTCRGSGRVGRC